MWFQQVSVGAYFRFRDREDTTSRYIKTDGSWYRDQSGVEHKITNPRERVRRAQQEGIIPMPRTVTYSQELRDVALRDKKHLITLDCPGATFQAPATAEEAQLVRALIMKLIKDRNSPK